uniref:Inactive tyrosine-protein kinase 7-like n=1 Tax=Sinocyclocheilus rhinocerous TaxID=307959 RepID=A0A673IKD4_9TELE
MAAFSVFIIQASSLQFKSPTQSQDALHGRSAILRCELSGPADMRFWWTQDVCGGVLERAVLGRLFVFYFSHGCGCCCVSSGLERGPVTMNEPASEAELEEAERIVLQCHIDGHPRPSSKWFKDGDQLDRKDRILMLTSLSTGDSGIYSCCAQNAAGKVCSNHNITLNIIDESVPRVLVAPVDQVVLRDEEAVFHCQFRAKPPPLIEWFHNTEPVLNKSRFVVYANGTLHISQVKQRSTGVYKCVAQYGENKQVHVEAALRIAEIADMGERMFRVFTAGRSERVRCDPPQGQPEPQVWWERAGARVASEGRVHQRNGDLIFSPTDGSDSGVYTCVARNTAGQKQQELVVTVATSPEWIVQPQDTRVEEGQPGFLHCHARGTPEPRVTWYRKSVPISEEGSRYKLFSNGTLRINSAELKDAQTYSCVCVTEGGSLIGHAQVLILEKLKFTPVPQPSQCLQLDRESGVSCVAAGRETPIIHWSRADGADLPSHVSQMNGVLRFSTVTRADRGNYTCVASSSAEGEIRAHVHLTVGVHVEFKLEPEQTTVYQGHTAVFHCQASGDPQPYVQWMLKDKLLSSSSSSRFQKMPNGSLVISDVTTEDTGVYTCIAGNTCNIRDTAAQLYVVEKPVHPRSEDEDKSQFKMFQTIALSVAVAVAYIIAVLGLMFYCKQRRKNKRLQKNRAGEEPEMECLNGTCLNGHRMSEIQEEVALSSMRPSADSEKQQSCGDKLHFPRAHLQTITSLGRGVFGEVFLAKARAIEEAEPETLVLVKSLESREETHRTEFRRELEMFSKLNHAHVVRLLGICRETQPHYMILEYVDLKLACFQALRNIIPFPNLCFSRVFQGDLKQFLRISKCSKADVWAFGVLMLEVFSLGELPYPALNDHQVLEGLQAGTLRLSPPVNCPAHVCSLMSRCWASSPKERPTFSEILQTLTDSSTDTKV